MLWISQAAVAAVKLKYQKLAESMFDDEFSKDQVTLIALYHNCVLTLQTSFSSYGQPLFYSRLSVLSFCTIDFEPFEPSTSVSYDRLFLFFEIVRFVLLETSSFNRLDRPLWTRPVVEELN